MVADAPFDLTGTTVAVVGRLGALALSDAESALADQGARLRRAPSRATRVVAVGHRAYTLIESGRLERRLGTAARAKARVVSENTLLRLLGLGGPLAAGERSLSATDIGKGAGLAADVVRWLTLFDVIEPDGNGAYAFRDLVAAKDVGRRLGRGETLSQILGDMVAAPARGAAERGRRVRNDAQLALPLGNPGNPAADDLFEAAYSAEEDGDLASAQDLYRRCVDADRRDPTALFNLANVLAALGHRPEARLTFERALVLDPGLVEARYNLAHLLDADGDEPGAKAQLEVALRRDAEYGDAWFNLAAILTRESDWDAAIRAWERYLDLDPAGAWSERARQSLALCRMERQARSA